MTTVNYTQTEYGQGTITTTWSGLAGSNVGQAMQWQNLADKTVQVFGTIGAPITIEGSNDGTNWVTLTNPAGDSLSFSSAGISLITEAPLFVRPNCASGTTNATVIIVANKS